MDKLSDLLAVIIAPIVAALIAALSAVARDWRLRRTAAGLQLRAFDQATKQVAFIDNWLNVYRKVAGPDHADPLLRRAVEDLEQAYFRVIRVTTVERLDHRRSISDLLKSGLLIPLVRPAARTIRGLYYIALSLNFVLQIGLAPSMFTDLRTADDIFLELIGWVVEVSLPLVPAIVLWHLAKYLDRAHPLDRSLPEKNSTSG